MYATVEETNQFVQAYYSSTDALRIAWEALSNEDKLVQLNKAERSIDSLPYKGRAIEANAAFPREPRAEESLVRVKQAAMALAVQLLDTENSGRQALRRQGVRSYRIGDFSETLTGSSALNGVDETAYSVVLPYLRTWLSGGYRICPTRTRK